MDICRPTCIPALQWEPRTDGVLGGRSLAEQRWKGSHSAILTRVSLQDWYNKLDGTGGSKRLGGSLNTYSLYVMKNENPLQS